MKLGTKVKIIADHPRKGQDSISEWIGWEGIVTEHWKQKDSDLDKGDIQIYGGEGLGVIVLRSSEYEVIEGGQVDE